MPMRGDTWQFFGPQKSACVISSTDDNELDWCCCCEIYDLGRLDSWYCRERGDIPLLAVGWQGRCRYWGEDVYRECLRSGWWCNLGKKVHLVFSRRCATEDVAFLNGIMKMMLTDIYVVSLFCFRCIGGYLNSPLIVDVKGNRGRFCPTVDVRNEALKPKTFL